MDLTPSEPGRVNADLHPPECSGACARARTHLSDLHVRFVHGPRVRADDVLHVDDVAFFDGLEFLQSKRTEWETKGHFSARAAFFFELGASPTFDTKPIGNTSSPRALRQATLTSFTFARGNPDDRRATNGT